MPISIFHHNTVVFILSYDDLTCTCSYMCNVVLKELYPVYHFIARVSLFIKKLQIDLSYYLTDYLKRNI